MSFRNYDLFALTKCTRHLAMSLRILPECSYIRYSSIRTPSPPIKRPHDPVMKKLIIAGDEGYLFIINESDYFDRHTKAVPFLLSGHRSRGHSTRRRT
jgi:hypothetical protein